MARQRGRPVQFDAEAALGSAMTVFWQQGYSATSLDDLASAMGMNRPSIYRAFGDKKALYRLAINEFAQRMTHGFDETLEKETDLRLGLSNFYFAALEVYSAGEEKLGCMVMCTAPVAAASHPDVQVDLLNVIEQLDDRLCARLNRAIADRQLPKSTDVSIASKLLQAVLHSLAIRSRAGESRAVLEKFAEGSVDLLIG